jgi:hypothetical protein
MGYYWDGKESWTIYQDHNGESVRKRNGKKYNC